ncbi:MAG: DNA polymerase III subunit alpha [Alphaproteobacteria bacterium]|nr:DNA polymerase III subunit alpha [Alphaproteobacteria bacterium]
MAHADFVHLRTHTAYSLSEGALPIKELVGLCLSEAMPAVGIADTGNLFGALEASEALTAVGVQPLIGCLLALRRKDEGRRNGRPQPPERVLLLAQDNAGYANLVRLSSKAFLDSDPGGPAEVTLDDLATHAGGLLLLTGAAEGPLGRLLLDGQREAARALAGKLAAMFAGRCYVEVQRHGTPAEQATEPGFLELAYGLDLPLVATNDVYFASADMHEAHDVLLCIEQGCAVDASERRRVTPEHHFKSAKAMQALFADLPEATANTLVIARRCAVRAPKRKPILPKFGADEPELLRRMAMEGLDRRLADLPAVGLAGEPAQPYRERLAFELKVIAEMGYAGYFLIVADFIQWALGQGIPVGPGRGSGAGSVVAWALRITDLDPLRFGLLFERFLNPERVSMPDFDIDFCQDRREEVIRYVQRKYGPEQVAQIITFGKLQARAVLRDVGRALGMAYGHVDRLCKLVPNNPANPVSLQKALESEPRLAYEVENEPQVAKLFDVARRLEGLYRHASTHAAGLVIGDRPLSELVPLYRDPRSDMPVTQFNMKWVEAAGLVKFDFLGLKTLTVLDHTVRLLARRGIAIDLGRLPLDDGPTYAMLQRAEVMGVFQFESGGMRNLLRDTAPSNIEDLIALVALFRPGPMENIPKYIACKHGREAPEFLHETIEPVVRDTYGVIIYQEQVMQIAQVFAGFTLGQADILRRAMGKKNKAEMEAQRESFLKGAMARGVSAERAGYVFDLVDKFAGYGFNKAHSAGYALVAYQTAYLKANHPVEFLAASMSLDMGNTDKLNLYRQELARLGIRLLPPDLNRSEVDFSVEPLPEGGSAIRYALAAIRNVGREAMRQLQDEREANGAFRDLWDCARRLDPRQVNKRQLESLAKAGALDGFGVNRAAALKAVDLLLGYAQRSAEERGSQQESLFAGTGQRLPPPQPPAAEESSLDERLAHEFDAIGFYLSAHPLDGYARFLARAEVCDSAELPARAGRGANWARVAGTLLGKTERSGRDGSRFARLSLSDRSGIYEVTAFAEVLNQARELLQAGRRLLLEVAIRNDGEQLRLTAQTVEDLAAASARGSSGLRIFLRDERPLNSLRQLLGQGARGKGRVRLVMGLAELGKEVELVLPGPYAISPQIRSAIEGLNGVLDVHDA